MRTDISIHVRESDEFQVVPRHVEKTGRDYSTIEIEDENGNTIRLYVYNDEQLDNLQHQIYQLLHIKGYYDHPDQQRILNAEYDGIEQC